MQSGKKKKILLCGTLRTLRFKIPFLLGTLLIPAVHCGWLSSGPSCDIEGIVCLEVTDLKNASKSDVKADCQDLKKLIIADGAEFTANYSRRGCDVEDPPFICRDATGQGMNYVFELIFYRTTKSKEKKQRELCTRFNGEFNKE